MPSSSDSTSEQRESRVVAFTALGVLAAMILRATLGTGLYDASYYVVVPLRFAQGARILGDEMAIQSIGSIVAAPFVKAWTALFGLSGLVLAVQLFYVAIAAVAAYYAYRLLRPSLRPAVAALAIGLPLLAPPYHLIAPSYNTIAELSFMLAICLAFAAMRDHSRAKAAGVGVAMVAGVVAYPPLVIAAVVLFATFAIVSRREWRLPLTALAAGLGTAAVIAAAIFSAVTVAEIRVALDFATQNVTAITSPLHKLSVYVSRIGGALVSAWLIPMWVLAAVATIPAVPRRLRAVALAIIPLAAAIPGLLLVIRADDFTFGVSAPSWFLTFMAGILVPTLFWAFRRRRRDVLRLLALSAPFAIVGFATVSYATSSSWNRGTPVIVVASLGLALIAGWAEEIAEAGRGVLLAIGSACAVAAVLGLLFATIFGDSGLLLPHTLVTSGPYAGLTIGVERAQELRDLEAAGKRWVKPGDGVVFMGEREAFLLVGGTIDTPAVWLAPTESDRAAIIYYNRPGNAWPKVAFVDDYDIARDGGYQFHPARDPLLTRILADYKKVGTVVGYSVFVRR